MNIATFIAAGIACLLPIAELRGGLPIALAGGMHPLLAYFYCVAMNILVTPVALLFLTTFHKLFLRFGWYKKFSEKIIERARQKVKTQVDKYGFIGLAIFVAIPLPLTGAYSGALGAWILGMDMKKAFLAVSLGVAIAGGLVLGAYYLVSAGFGFFGVFIKTT
jgi:uncharacterized membrane protein